MKNRYPMTAILAVIVLLSVFASDTSLASGKPEEIPECYCCVKTTYSGNLHARENDFFMITYSQEGSDEELKLRITGMETAEQIRYLKLEEGAYEVTDISYEGKNQLVTEQGYAVTTEFSSREEGGSILFIAVGNSAVKSLDTSYENVMIKQGDEYVSTVLEAETETQVITESETVTGADKSKESQAGQGKTGNQTEVNRTMENRKVSENEMPVVEDYRRETQVKLPEKDSRKKEDKTRLVFFFAVIMATGTGGFILHRKTQE